MAPEAAATLQTELAATVIRVDALGIVRRVAGVDVAYDEARDRVVGAVAVLDAETLEPIETLVASGSSAFRYIPGLFSFREIPVLIEALGRLTTAVDLIVCDGHGIAHPRRFGLASHLGSLFDVPAIGCAKTLLTGQHDQPSAARGSTARVLDGSEEIGSVLRTQKGVRPVYVSIGHRVSLATACQWVLRLSPRFRLPETTRIADQAVRRALGNAVRSSSRNGST